MVKSQAQSQSDGEQAPEWARVQTGTEGTGPEAEVIEATVVETGGRSLAETSPAMMSVVAWCQSHVEHTDGDEAAAMEDIVRRVLAAENPAEVFEENLTVPVEDILGTPIAIHGFRIGETEFTDGFPYYALVDFTAKGDPKVRVATVGAFKVMAQLMALDRMGEWPQVCMFKQSDKQTKAGYRPISLVRAV